MSYFRAREYIVQVLVEMVVEVDDVRVGDGFHYLELSIFVLFVLVHVLYCHFLPVPMQVFRLLFTIYLTKYTHPNVPLPTICIFWYLFCCGPSFFIFFSLFTLLCYFYALFITLVFISSI